MILFHEAMLAQKTSIHCKSIGLLDMTSQEGIIFPIITLLLLFDANGD